ncbi:MAG: molybdenum ABC transporter permease, partial [Phycisphaerae bacterium]|nr:molybdenum ABC transporter permease [Phycisphaerae bacterium]
LGASKGQAFFRLTMPMSRDGIPAAGVMTWARAIGEFGPILIFNGTMQMNTEVLPTSIFLEFQVGNLQGSLAVSMLMVLIAVGTLLLFKKLGGIRYV